MNKYISFVLAFFLLFCLGACGNATDSASSAQDDQIAALESRIAELEENEQKEDESEPQTDIFKETCQYIQVIEAYKETSYPILTLYDDGTFEFRINMLYTMDFLYGEYTVSGDIIQLDVQRWEDFTQSYPGPNDVSFVISEDDLIVKSGMGESMSGDVFTRSTKVISTDIPIDERIPADVTPFRIGSYVGFVEADGGLNLRGGPGAEFDSITLIPDGLPISVYGISEVDAEWYFVVYNDEIGYVNSEYITLGHM